MPKKTRISETMAKAMIKSMEKIDDSMSYEDLALAVAKILVENYGKHNYLPFMKVLKNNLK